MKQLLLLALLLPVLIAGAQDKPDFGRCEALFTYRVNNELMSPLPGTAVNFYDLSTGNVQYWFWDFGDGSTSTEQNPMHRFNFPLATDNVKASPYHTVSLTILSADSCKSLNTQTIYIAGDTVATVPACRASFKSYQSSFDSINKVATVQFNNFSEGEALGYLWQFDDGKTSTDKEPQVAFDLSQKERKVCLTVTGKNGCTDIYCDAVYLYDPTIKVDTIYPEPVECETAFGYTVNHDIKTFAPALVLDFYSKAYPDPVKWNWDFGDGSTSEEANPTHIFNYPLTKEPVPGDSLIGLASPFRNVCLTVETNTGCVASYCQMINIYMDQTPVDPVPQCHAWIKYYRLSDVVSIPEVVVYKFLDASQEKVVSRLWQFEDGTTSTEAEPQVSFSIFKPTQKVVLTINTADNCSSTWAETVYISNVTPPDSGYVDKPYDVYRMKYESSFPIYMSSCAGWAKAQVYMNDSLVNATNYIWSTGTEGQEVKQLCPTQTYTVKAIAPDGTYVSGTFVFNADGTVTDSPFNWWVSGGGSDNPLIKCDPANKDYTVEWKLCDGTVVKSDSINLNLINCGGNESNMTVKDAAGQVIYSEQISQRTLITDFNPVKEIGVKLYPNPVGDVLNILYSGNPLAELQLEVWDMTGRRVSVQKFHNVESGQQISINVNTLDKGMYLCKMVSEQKVIKTAKFNK